MRLFGFAGWSGSGKTTLIERVVPKIPHAASVFR
jgi:molybdopterin-guanine dinucleotide biosynthesis protein